MTIVLQTPVFSEEVPDKGSADGHVHFSSSSILLKDIELCAFAASMASTLLYEKLQAGGTTIIINIAKDGAKIDVLARYENDGVDLQWGLKPGEAKKLDEVQERILSKTFMLMHEPKKSSDESSKVASTDSIAPKESKPMPITESAHEPTTRQEEKEDYLVKQLHRTP